jgi:sugar (pentulose or hexulose) kinase
MALIVTNPGGALGPMAAFGGAVGTAVVRGVGDRLASLFASKALDAGQTVVIATAMQGVMDQAATEIERYVAMIAPYATKGYYAFIICAALYALNSANSLTGGLIGEGIRAIIMTILRLGKSLASMTASGSVAFAKASFKFLKWLAKADTKGAIKEGARRLANAIGHRVRNVKEAASKLKGMAAQARAATMTRLRKVVGAVGAARNRLAKYRAARAERVKLAKNASELKKIINKVRASNVPLTLVEKKKYLAYAHKANQNAQKTARNTRAAANQLGAMQAAKAIAKKRARNSPGNKRGSKSARVTVVSVGRFGRSAA